MNSVSFACRLQALRLAPLLAALLAVFSAVAQTPNQAPVVVNPVPNPRTVEGVAFSFMFEADTFADADAGQTLTYTTSRLPGWLAFDAATRTFSGVPDKWKEGSVLITLTATDSGSPALKARDKFLIKIRKVNDPDDGGDDDGETGYLVNPIPDQSATAGTAFQFTFAADTFSGGERGVLTYAAGPLPGWLAFDAATRTFAGTPMAADAGFADITVSVTGGCSESVTARDTFRLTVTNSTPPPPVTNAPAITAQPVGRTNECGSEAVFAVEATGDAVLVYQWRRGGIALPSATNAVLAFTAATDVAGGYSVVVANASGAVTSVVATLVIADNTPPVIACPADVAVVTDAGRATASDVVLGTAAASDNCGGVTVSHNGPAVFPVGVNFVVWTAVDAAGNTASCTQQVVVADVEPPVIASPAGGFAPLQFTTPVGGMVALPDYAAQAVVSDNVAVASVTQSPAAGTQMAPGTFTVEIVAVDTAGNRATNAFIVGAAEPPNIPPVAAGQTFSLDEDTSVNFTLDARDPDGTALTVVIATPPARGRVNVTGLDAEYVPDANYNGLDSFRFYVRDARGGTSTVETMRFIIASVADVTAMSAHPPTNYPALPDPRDLLVGDFKHDSNLDLLLLSRESNCVQVLSGSGRGHFTNAPIVSPVGNRPHRLTGGDFLHDAYLDLAVADEASDVHILLGTGTGVFTNAPGGPIHMTGGALALAVGNFWGDTKPDLAVLNTGGITVLRGRPYGVFDTPIFYPLPAGDYRDLRSSDFNNDGRTDLAVVDAAAGRVLVLLNLKSSANTNFPAVFTNITAYPASDGAGSLTVCDVNKDTFEDLFTANRDDGTVSIFLGRADGTFATSTPRYVGPEASTVALGDLDKDGSVDMAVALEGGDVHILSGNGDGTFNIFYGDQNTVYPIGFGEKWAATADFNKDSFPDVAVVNGASGTVTILIKNTAPRAYAQQVIVLEDTSKSFSLGANFGPANFTLVKLPVGGSVTGTPPHLVYVPPADFYGSETLDYRVDDGSTTSAVARVLLRVTQVNDAPSFELVTNAIHATEDDLITYYTNFAANFDPGATNEVRDAFRFYVTTDAPELFHLEPLISSAGVLSFTPKLHAYGTARVTVLMADSGGTNFGGVNLSGSREFTLTIAPVNDTPTMLAVGSLTILANTTATFPLKITDVETAASELTLSFASTNETLVPLYAIVQTANGGTNRTVAVTPAPGARGTTLLTFIVSDGTNSSSRSAMLTVR